MAKVKISQAADTYTDTIADQVVLDSDAVDTISDAVQATAGEFTQTAADARYLGINDPATGLTETDGPTDLAMGDVADGEYLKRVGAAIVGAAGGSGLADAAAVTAAYAASPSEAGALADALAAGPGSLRELVAGMNALLLYLAIDPAVLVDDNGDPLVDDNGNLIIG